MSELQRDPWAEDEGPIQHQIPVVFRRPTPRDDAYALSSMVKTVLGMGGQRPPSYSDMDHRGLSSIEDELRRRWRDPSYVRAIACFPEDPWLIAGFVLGRPLSLTFLSVRSGYTGLGLGTALLAGLGIDRETPAVVEFPTWDLERPVAGITFPIGILNSGRWPHLHLVPWTASERP